jgi:hypothetical protein
MIGRAYLGWILACRQEKAWTPSNRGPLPATQNWASFPNLVKDVNWGISVLFLKVNDEWSSTSGK